VWAEQQPDPPTPVKRVIGSQSRALVEFWLRCCHSKSSSSSRSRCHRNWPCVNRQLDRWIQLASIFGKLPFGFDDSAVICITRPIRFCWNWQGRELRVSHSKVGGGGTEVALDSRSLPASCTQVGVQHRLADIIICS